MTSEKVGAGAKVHTSEKQGLKGGAKGVSPALVPPNLTERQQLAILLKQTKAESLPAPSESHSEQSDSDASSSSSSDNRRKRKGNFSERDHAKRQKGESKQKDEADRKHVPEDRKQNEERRQTFREEESRRQMRDSPDGEQPGEVHGLEELAPSGFGHSARLPPPIPMPRGMGKRTRVRQRRTGAGDLRPHEGSGSGEDDDDPLPVRRPEEYASWPPAKQAAWNNLAMDANAFYEKYAPPGHELDLGEWTSEEQSRFLQVLRDHPVENDQWGLFSMHFPSRNGMQCRQFHSKLVRSGVFSGEGQAPSSSRSPVEPVQKAAPQRTSSPTVETRNEEERGERKRTNHEPISKQPAVSARSDEGPSSGDRSEDYRGGEAGGSEWEKKLEAVARESRQSTQALSASSLALQRQIEEVSALLENRPVKEVSLAATLKGASEVVLSLKRRFEAGAREREESAQALSASNLALLARQVEELSAQVENRPVNEVSPAAKLKGASISQPGSREGGPPSGIEDNQTSEQKNGKGNEETPEEPVMDDGEASTPASAYRTEFERRRFAPADADRQAKKDSTKSVNEPEIGLQPALAPMSVGQVHTVESAKKSGSTSGAEPTEKPGSRVSTVLEKPDAGESGYQEQVTGGSQPVRIPELAPESSRPPVKTAEGNGSFRAATTVIIARHRPAAANDASKLVGVGRRQLSSHVTSNAPAVALALPAIPKPEEGLPAASAKQIRLPNGKFGPSIQKKPEEGVRETSGPITLFRTANGEKVSLTIRKRESDGEDGGKKRAHKGGGEVLSDTPKGLTVLLGGKTVHKRPRLSDPARAGSPARERAKEYDGGGGLKSSDAVIKPTKKVRIRHPTEGGGQEIPEEWDKGTPLSREERKRNRVGGSALKPRVLGSPPRLASNASTPSGPDGFAEEDGGSLQTGGMSARVSSRELQQLLPSSSPAYSPLMSLTSARKRDREVLNGPDRFRRGVGFEEREPAPPVHARRLLTACRLLGVLDRREAKWHANISGGWTEEETGPREHHQNEKGEPNEVGGKETKVPEAKGGLPGARDDPPEARQDPENGPEAGEKTPETAERPVKTGANFFGEDGEPSVDGRGAEERPRNGMGVEVRLFRGGGVAPPLGGGVKLPEAILRRREELFAERVKLQKRWHYEYEILESTFEQQYEQAVEDEGEYESKGGATPNAFNHTLRPCRGQPEAANSALRGGEGAQPSVPHPFTKPYVEMLFKRSREDLLHRYKIEADALDNWHRWLAESSGPLMSAARSALEQLPLDPQHLINV